MKEVIKDLYHQFSLIERGICQIETVPLRLIWQKDLWLGKKIDNILWIEFSICDIDFFHVKYRIIFDYIAKIN